MYGSLFYQLANGDDGGGGFLFEYLVILGIIIVGFYVGYYLLINVFSKKRARQHPCKYCGHIVDSVSDCCRAPVDEKFMAGKCTKCKKTCDIICAKCKRPLH